MFHFRNALATLSRTLPQFRGKGPLGVGVGRLLTDIESNEDCITTIKMKDGTLMRVDIRSITERWAYWTGDYDQEVISRLASCLQKQSVVFDVGANIGFYSIALGNKLAALEGKLHAFEPVRSNFDRLVWCVEANGLEGTVSAHNVALGDEEGTIEMFMANDDNAITGNAVLMKGRVPQENYSQGNASSPITTLDAFVQEKQITACHLIKVDVEGAEVMFLRGGIGFLSKHRPIIYGEFNPYWLNQFGHSFVDVGNIVQPWDYRLFKQVKHKRFTEFTRPEVGIENVLMCPSETPDATLAELGVLM